MAMEGPSVDTASSLSLSVSVIATQEYIYKFPYTSPIHPLPHPMTNPPPTTTTITPHTRRTRPPTTDTPLTTTTITHLTNRTHGHHRPPTDSHRRPLRAEQGQHPGARRHPRALPHLRPLPRPGACLRACLRACVHAWVVSVCIWLDMYIYMEDSQSYPPKNNLKKNTRPTCSAPSHPAASPTPVRSHESHPLPPPSPPKRTPVTIATTSPKKHTQPASTRRCAA